MKTPTPKKSLILSNNYSYSLAISKCNKKLEKLKNEQYKLYQLQNQLNMMPDYRNILWPLRKPVNPNPMIYIYQFLPPKIYEPLNKPIRTFPVSRQTIQFGNRMKQNGADCDDLRKMLIYGIDNILTNELLNDERKMNVYLEKKQEIDNNGNYFKFLKDKKFDL